MLAKVIARPPSPPVFTLVHVFMRRFVPIGLLRRFASVTFVVDVRRSPGVEERQALGPRVRRGACLRTPGGPSTWARDRGADPTARGVHSYALAAAQRRFCVAAPLRGRGDVAFARNAARRRQHGECVRHHAHRRRAGRPGLGTHETSEPAGTRGPTSGRRAPATQAQAAQPHRRASMRALEVLAFHPAARGVPPPRGRGTIVQRCDHVAHAGRGTMPTRHWLEEP
jgi:hypothetical protein